MWKSCSGNIALHLGHRRSVGFDWLYSLSCFDDAEKERMPVMVWKAGWKEVKSIAASFIS